MTNEFKGDKTAGKETNYKAITKDQIRYDVG